MSLNKWFKKQIGILSLAMGGVEKNLLGQNSQYSTAPINQERRHTQGTLADSLKHGEVTQEVMNLRWRMYKILKESVVAEVVGYDENNLPITKVRRVDKKRGLSKIKVDNFDKYTVEMVLDNEPIVTGGGEAMENEYITVLPEARVNYDDNGEVISATHGEITGSEYFATNKQELPLKITRSAISNFEIETYTKKLVVRTINKTDRLLEFYVSMYPDEFNRTTRLFISEIKKLIENPRTSTILEINEAGFITYKTLGVDDFKEYQYKIKSFDKIIEFNGHYVIKFISEVIIDGHDILEEYRVEALDEKYKNKEKRKQ